MGPSILLQEQDSDNTDWIINQSAVKWQQLGPKKDTGAEVLMDMDFTQLANQTLTNNQYNSVGV